MPTVYLAALPPVLVNMVIVGVSFVYFGPPFPLCAMYVGIGQFIACYLLGVPLDATAWEAHKSGRGGPRPLSRHAFFFHFVPSGVSSRRMPLAARSSRIASDLLKSLFFRAALRSAISASISSASSSPAAASSPRTPRTESIFRKNSAASSRNDSSSVCVSFR